MKLPSEGRLLRIFIGESNRYQGQPLYEWLVIKAKEQGLAGATVIRGIMGYGANSMIHTSKIMRLSMDLPIVVECVDTREKIDAFLSLIDSVLQDGLVTLEDIRVHSYRSNSRK